MNIVNSFKQRKMHSKAKQVQKLEKIFEDDVKIFSDYQILKKGVFHYLNNVNVEVFEEPPFLAVQAVECVAQAKKAMGLQTPVLVEPKKTPKKFRPSKKSYGLSLLKKVFLKSKAGNEEDWISLEENSTEDYFVLEETMGRAVEHEKENDEVEQRHEGEKGEEEVAQQNESQENEYQQNEEEQEQQNVGPENEYEKNEGVELQDEKKGPKHLNIQDKVEQRNEGQEGEEESEPADIGA